MGTCLLLQQDEAIRQHLCVPGLRANYDARAYYDICAETCGKCSDSCSDNDNVYFEYGVEGEYQDCEWVRSQNLSALESICQEGGNPNRFCRETCNSCCEDGSDCSNSCNDSDGLYFEYDSDDLSDNYTDCQWVHSQNSSSLESTCEEGGNPHRYCRETCNACCQDRMDKTFS